MQLEKHQPNEETQTYSDRNGMNSLIRKQDMQDERAGIRENFQGTIGTQCTENLQEMTVTLLILLTKGSLDWPSL